MNQLLLMRIAEFNLGRHREIGSGLFLPSPVFVEEYFQALGHLPRSVKPGWNLISFPRWRWGRNQGRDDQLEEPLRRAQRSCTSVMPLIP
jgi:hypothetical protein